MFTALRQDLQLYLHPRVVIVFLLGTASGLPLLLTLSTLDIWLREAGVSRATIGLFALVGLPYTLKFIWAPVIDHVRLPWLGRARGHRRSWLLLTQGLLMLSIIGLGQMDPVAQPLAVAGFALLVAFCSASQDVVIDGYRVEILKTEQQGAGAAVIVAGYRIGMLISGAGALYLASALDWGQVYVIMAAVLLLGWATVLLGPEPEASQSKQLEFDSLQQWLRHSVLEPFIDFARRPQWLYILLFIILFKLGDAMLSKMASPFYIDAGFSKIEIANISKIYGTLATLLGGFMGGVLVYRVGIWRGLWLTGVLQIVSNLVFAWQAVVGHDVSWLILTIGVENLSGGMGTAVFVAYLSSLCAAEHTATQYALLSALMSVPRTILTAISGWLADQMTWPQFFVVTALVALPGLVMVWGLRGRGEDGGLK